jgi:mono/diheme cytochrome c family protein
MKGSEAGTAMRRPRVGGRGALAALLAAVCLAAPTATVALAHTSASANGEATIVGNAAAGKSLFVTTCGACHTLKAAGTLGNLGPNLTTAAVPLTEQTIINAITNGGASVMTKAAVAQYSTTMVAYKGTLTTAQIADVAAYIYSSTHATTTAPAKPIVSSFTPASGKKGTTITVAGKNFVKVTAVKLGPARATFKLVSASKLTLTVPATAKSGRIYVTTAAGTAGSSKSFTVKAA